MAVQEIYLIVSGRVQMVMFRDFIYRKATSLGLTGYVKNIPDGTVEIRAQCSFEQLQKLIKLAQKGSILSRVDKVEERWDNGLNSDYKSFKIQK